MNNEIRAIKKEDCEQLARILAKAWPSPDGDTEESRAKHAQRLEHDLDQEKDAGHALVGAFRGSQLLGAMTLLEYRMNLRSSTIRLGGIGGLCVDFLHKKEKVSRDLLAYALQHLHDSGVNMISLYPFNSEFYKRMGFGFGTMMHQYRVRPEAFPRGKSKQNIEYLTSGDKAEMLACYHKYSANMTGMFAKREHDLNGKLGFGNTAVGVKQDGRITGYIIFRFKRTTTYNSSKNDLLVTDFVYTSGDALAELCTFLNSQSDQIHRVIVNTQDEQFYYLFNDPTNGRLDSFEAGSLESRVTAISSMYRIVNTKQLFTELSNLHYGSGTCRLKINVQDDFFEPNHGSIVVHFVEGKATVIDDERDGQFDVMITLNVANFSSLMVGAIGFKALYQYGLAHISDEMELNTVHSLFAVDRLPQCDTFF